MDTITLLWITFPITRKGQVAKKVLLTQELQFITLAKVLQCLHKTLYKQVGPGILHGFLVEFDTESVQ